MNQNNRKQGFSTNLAQLRFLIVPFTTLVFWPNILDSNGLPRLIAFLIGTFILILSINRNTKIKWITLLPFLLPILYLLSQFNIANSILGFLFGSYGRIGGFISILVLVTIFVLVSNSDFKIIEDFMKMFMITYTILIVFGFLQQLNLLPFRQTTEFNALSLTVGNPNFASALIGIMFSANMALIIFTPNYRRFRYLLLNTGALVNLFLIKSLQGFLVLLILSTLIIIVRFRDRLVFVPKKIRTISALTILIGTILLINTPVAKWVYENGSVGNRLAYWKLSWTIFKDNLWLGVGIDNLRSYVLKYRDLDMALQEGVFTIPDRSHNVYIDYFVNGGILTGFTWLSFVIWISILMFKMLKNEKSNDPRLIFISLIWVGYNIQALISVDHLSLTLLGFLSAALIVAKWNSTNGLVENTYIAKALPFTILKNSSLGIVIFFTMFTSSLIPAELNAASLYYKNDYTKVKLIENSSRIQVQTLERVMVKLSQANQIEMADKLADKLLAMAPSNHQAFYVKSVFQESIGNDLGGKEWMLKAHKSDEWNPVYLLSLSIYEYKLGNYDEAISYLERTESINPNQQGLDIVKNLLANK